MLGREDENTLLGGDCTIFPRRDRRQWWAMQMRYASMFPLELPLIHSVFVSIANKLHVRGARQNCVQRNLPTLLSFVEERREWNTRDLYLAGINCLRIADSREKTFTDNSISRMKENYFEFIKAFLLSIKYFIFSIDSFNRLINYFRQPFFCIDELFIQRGYSISLPNVR